MPDGRPLIVDLACELSDCLGSLPDRAYREQIHMMMSELLEVHRGDLVEEAVGLAEQTVATLAPSATPSWAELADLAHRWDDALDSGPGPARTYNAHGFCLALMHVENDLNGRRTIGMFVDSAIVGWQIRPLTPAETGPDRISTVTADPAAPEIKLLMRFIASARQALAAAGTRKIPWQCRGTIQCIEARRATPDEPTR